MIDTDVAESNLIVWDEIDDDEDVLQKIIYNADRSNISKVWVQGKQIK